MSESHVLKARGLPWSATAEEVVKFFSDVDISHGEEGVHFTYTNEGRPSGECFIEVTTTDDVEKALAHDNEHMGKRYIEVKEAKHSEMEWVVNRMSNSTSHVGSTDGVIRLRGLPYGCSKQDIAEFFSGLQICPYGITITMDQDGRASGDAYVEFATPDDAEQAMGKHKEKIGHRYIEIFRSSKSDIKYVVGRSDGFRPAPTNFRPGPYDRPPSFGGSRARGRGGIGLGPSGFSSSSNFGSNYDGGMRSSRGKGGPMRGGRSSGMGGGKITVQNSKTGHSVHMRGLPFEATTTDVLKFFAPLNAVDVRILYEPNGRAKGECDVDFSSHNDAEVAMHKDKQNMGHRYIELFLKSTPTGSMSGGGSSGSDGGGSGWFNNSTSPRGGAPVPLMGRGGGGGGADNMRNNSYGGGYGNMDKVGSNLSDGGMGGYPANSSYSANSSGYVANTDGYSQQNDSYGGNNYQSFSDNVMYPNIPSAGGNYYGANMR